jgi:hypothetical protein
LQHSSASTFFDDYLHCKEESDKVEGLLSAVQGLEQQNELLQARVETLEAYLLENQSQLIGVEELLAQEHVVVTPTIIKQMGGRRSGLLTVKRQLTASSSDGKRVEEFEDDVFVTRTSAKLFRNDSIGAANILFGSSNKDNGQMADNSDTIAEQNIQDLES